MGCQSLSLHFMGRINKNGAFIHGADMLADAAADARVLVDHRVDIIIQSDCLTKNRAGIKTGAAYDPVIREALILIYPGDAHGNLLLIGNAVIQRTGGTNRRTFHTDIARDIPGVDHR